MIAEGECWQIYLTNEESYVLAVTARLYEKWVREYSLPEGLFEDTGSCRVLESSCGYMISSLESGPFPGSSAQVTAFSAAYKKALDSFPDMDLRSAVYIEEYSMLLPSSFDGAAGDRGLIYGKWLAGGISVSVDSFDRLAKVMSWLPADALRSSAELAGFDVPEGSAAKKIEREEEAQDAAKEKTDKAAVLLPAEEFSLPGRPELEQFFRENIIDVVTHQEEYKRMGITFPGATILYGPPGCGKTFAIDRLSEYLGWPRFDIDSSTIASAYIHETSRKISEIFQAAVNAAPSIIVIDEMEAFLSDRGKAAASGPHRIEEVAEFLRRIPDAVSKGVLIFAMTNMLDSIDPAVLRRGRFDHMIEIKMATAEEIRSLLENRLRDLPVDETVRPDAVASALDGHPLSDVTFVLREAGRFAVRRKQRYISQACFDDALGMLPKNKERRRIGFTIN